MKQFVSLSGRDMLPFASGILTAVLPCFAYDDKTRKSILASTETKKLWKWLWHLVSYDQSMLHTDLV